MGWSVGLRAFCLAVSSVFVETKFQFISKQILVHSGAPQRSHSGPVLFYLFMNDIVDHIQSHISSLVQLGLRKSADFVPTTAHYLRVIVLSVQVLSTQFVCSTRFSYNRIMQIEAGHRRFLHTPAFKANMDIRGDSFYIPI